MIALRLLATAALAADLWTTLRIVRTEGNPILRWLANRTCVACVHSRRTKWCWWARALWWGWWIGWGAAMWLIPWQFVAMALAVEVAVISWNVYRWRCRQTTPREGEE